MDKHYGTGDPATVNGFPVTAQARRGPQDGARSSWIAVARWRPRPSCLPHGDRPLAVELIEGHGAGGEREPGRDARMPPGSGTGLRMAGLPAGCLRTPGDPGPGGGRQPGIIE